MIADKAVVLDDRLLLLGELNLLRKRRLHGKSCEHGHGDNLPDQLHGSSNILHKIKPLSFVFDCVE